MRCLLFFSFSHNFKLHTNQSGLTLIELLTVISLLIITASVAVTSYNGLEDEGRYDVAKFEMTQIHKALIQFRKDSGTNSFPTQGSYDCTDEVNGGVATEANSLFVFPTDITGTDAELIEWCQHPANFWMLFEDPFGRDDDEQWNLDTKRGWNGPYLQHKDGFLTLNSNVINLDDIAYAVRAIANPYVVDQQNSGVEWSFEVAGNMLEQAGAPYVLLVDITNTPVLYEPRLISAGEDGVFEINNLDDCVNSQELDQVLCLLK